jgi:hypothetical protein
MTNDEILKIAAEGERIKQSSAEFHILRGVTPPKLEDALSTTAAPTNPLRRANGVATSSTASFGETRLDFSAARPHGSGGAPKEG